MTYVMQSRPTANATASQIAQSKDSVIIGAERFHIGNTYRMSVRDYPFK